MASLGLGVEVRAASWTTRSLGSGFINSPITNLDASAVPGVRSNSIFLLAEPGAPPEPRGPSCQFPSVGGGWGSQFAVDSELLPN